MHLHSLSFHLYMDECMFIFFLLTIIILLIQILFMHSLNILISILHLVLL